ncbi:MAG: hypothetical protein LBF62_02035 [Tannerellaceae bacterium]|nr:hypothetical protein [Tannerellaceae bacterium]
MQTNRKGLGEVRNSPRKGLQRKARTTSAGTTDDERREEEDLQQKARFPALAGDAPQFPPALMRKSLPHEV